LRVSDLLSLLPSYVEEFDEPFADSSAFPTMAVARLARRQVTVALTGDGGDELCGGYHYYRLMGLISRAQRLPTPARMLLAGALGLAPGHKAKLAAGALRFKRPAEVFHYLRGFAKDFGPPVAEDVLHGTESSRSLFEQLAASCATDVSQAELGMRLDIGFMLPDGYLQKVDVATMAYSLEARCPMVDYRMVEWSMRLPEKFKISGSETKTLLKRLLCRYLPSDLVHQPKRGFGIPIAQWLRGPLRSWAESLIHDSSVMSRLPLDKSRIAHLFKLHMSGERDAHPILWATLMLLCFVARHDRGFDLEVPVTKKAA
jgi:asparagine synthase (glutamine-hydrolysing)